MYSKNIFRYWVVVSLLFWAGCKIDLDEPRYSEGSADFSRFVAVGTDLTAGYADGALTRSGQENSFPAILASRFALAGGGSFLQPLLSEGNGLGFLPTGTLVGKLKLSSVSNCLGQPDYTAAYSTGNLTDLQWIGSQVKFNNFGIPNAKSFNLYSQYFGKSSPGGNAYYHRFATDTGAVSGLTSTVLGDAFRVNPTFFSLWIGVNDVLFYAVNGGMGSESGLGTYDITPPDTFNYALDLIVNSLTSNGAKGLILNIPDIESLPFFSAIPYNGLNLSQAQADALNANSPSGVSFKAGANAFVVRNSSGNIRQLKKGELILMNMSPDEFRCDSLGTPQNPIPASSMLDEKQVDNIHTAISVFNGKLRSAALAKNLAYVDVKTLFTNLETGVKFNGTTYSTKYISGGAFSLDGLHPNAKGYALIANECIRAVNAQYKATLPEVDVNSYSGISFP